MSKKHSLRRTVAGILAVLTVTVNLIAPTQVRIPLAPEPIDAEAAYLQNSTLNPGFQWDAETQTLTITRGISNAAGVVGQDEDDALNFKKPNRINIGTLFNPDYLDPEDVKNIVIADGAELPQSCQALFTNFTNLETFKIEESVDASNVYNIESMFEGLTQLREVDFGGLIRTGNIDYVDNMFKGCTSLTSIDLSMLDGSNVGKRNWRGHKAIDHIRRAVAGCRELRELNLTGEFLDHCVKNIKNKDGGNVDIYYILNELLRECDSPYVDDIYASLLAAYINYTQAAQDEGAWHPWKWSEWTQSGDGFTCTLTLQRVVDGETEYDPTPHTPEITFIDDPAATCTKSGTRHYTAKWTNEKGVVFTNSTQQDQTIQKLDHDYELKSIEWSVSNSGVVSAKAIIMCQRDKCGQMSEKTLTPTKVGHFDATCTDPAHDLYEATYQGHTEQYAVVTGPALGHAWAEEGTWTWNGVESAQVEIACTREGCTKIVTLSGDAVTITSAVTSQPSCTAAGVRTYTATAEYEGKTYTDTKTEEIPVTSHQNVSYHAEEPASCTEDGVK
ncbi:MAG: hypothetical protein J5722_01275, partial [Oscillospiraceae bacterium]|nr:hypothetical protein [Oscillospiraceae bacterium]